MSLIARTLLKVKRNTFQYPGIAQVVERKVWDLQAVGASPTTRTKTLDLWVTVALCDKSRLLSLQILVIAETEKLPKPSAEEV